MTHFDPTGLMALIAGAASGMGRASAQALADHGADPLLADLNADGTLFDFPWREYPTFPLKESVVNFVPLLARQVT